MANQSSERSSRRYLKRKKKSFASSEGDVDDECAPSQPGADTDDHTEEKDEYLCAICLDPINFETQLFVTYCGEEHKFHSICAIPWVERTPRPPPCCVCRQPARSLSRTRLEVDCLQMLYRWMEHSSRGQRIQAASVRGPFLPLGWQTFPDPCPWSGKCVVYCCRRTRIPFPRAMRRVMILNGERYGIEWGMLWYLCEYCRALLSSDNNMFAGFPGVHEYPSCQVHGRMTIQVDLSTQSYRFVCLSHQIARRDDAYQVDCHLPAVVPAGWVVERDLVCSENAHEIYPRLFMRPSPPGVYVI